MESYKNNKLFIESVKSNTISDIKIALIFLVLYFKGDVKKIQDSISYAKDNSSFDFEEHYELPYDSSDEINESHFANLRLNLEENFSEKRLKAFLDVYHKIYKNEESAVHKKIKKKETENKNNISDLKILSLTAGAIIFAFILYKLLSK
ncbi:MAG: hypothetical protein LAT68_16100 [Cyclobacteriaceae bacterium]|nr:hypothetical protein [Cyclobacteriaceae bacterium]MCH8517840.1 hypothetical protein [Cyclobacteriaceae bacterium]